MRFFFKYILLNLEKIILKNMGKLENLLSFDDFDKTWSPKKQKATKRTEVGLDTLNENLYNKLCHPESPKYEKTIEEFLKKTMNYLGDNKIKPINIEGDEITFSFSGDPNHKHKLNKEAGSITVWKRKAETVYVPKKDDPAKRDKKKNSFLIEVTIPIGTAKAKALYNNLKKAKEAMEE